jgi:methylenetetrahydrofolate dehydrogenase (NADP+)/methenyltetrahydrofolate cyclohydrolase
MIIDGKAIAEEIQNDLKIKISSIQGRAPCLAVILVGEDPASEIYVRNKTLACERIGIRSQTQKYPATISEAELLLDIERLNQDPVIDGILVQLPLPKHINSFNVTMAIDPEKDVDGFHPINMGKLLIGNESGFIPCTPLGIKTLLEKSKVVVQGKHAVVVGRSTIVGKPMALLLAQKSSAGDATVTIAHSSTHDLKSVCLTADILIASVGKPHIITADMVKEGATVIDVGINRIHDPGTPRGYRIVGDVDYERVKDKCAHITPVPGGVGPMTIAMLLSNTVTSFLKKV